MRNRATASVIAAIAVVAVAYAVFHFQSAGPRIELPPVTATEFLNASPDIAYVGSASCVECHPDETASHLRTGHSQALTPTLDEPDLPETTFTHELSGRTYRVYRQDGRLRHEESVIDNGEKLVLADHALAYTIGSGNHAKSFLVGSDGFYFQSPITWFATKGKWELSPGYETLADQPGFSRIVNLDCLNCHSGGAAAVNGSFLRAEIRQQTIDCERCHGPGELHVQQRQADEPHSLPDLTIVNPAHLSRDLQEAICAQCHLEGAVRVLVRGRELDQFRPGLPLQDFKVVYQVRSAQREMKVVGHVEQMRLSKCYTNSETLTCVTCHNPHETPAAADRVQYFRSQCVSCHAEDEGEMACGLQPDVRRQREAQDNCVACHMPQSDTEVPHVAFTHHRIGIHGENSQTTLAAVGESTQLVPLHDLSSLPSIDQKRCFALASLEVAAREPDHQSYHILEAQAERLLQELREDGMRDPHVEVSLARIAHLRGDLPAAVEHAQDALRHGATLHEQIEARHILSSYYLQMNDYARARQQLDQLVELRRSPDDWLSLSFCASQSNDLDAALEAAQQAAAIAPQRHDVLQHLARIYEKAGMAEQAADYKRRARYLARKAPPQD